LGCLHYTEKTDDNATFSDGGVIQPDTKIPVVLQNNYFPPYQPLGPGIKSNLGVAEETLLHLGRLARVANVAPKIARD